MSGAWAAVAHRGEFSLDVLTRSRAFEECILLRLDCDFLMRLHTDDGEVVEICARTLGSLLEFIENMQPHGVELRGGQGENVDAIRMRLAGCTVH